MSVSQLQMGKGAGGWVQKEKAGHRQSWTFPRFLILFLQKESSGAGRLSQRFHEDKVEAAGVSGSAPRSCARRLRGVG